VKDINLAVKFVLELVALGSLAYWGANAGSGAWAVVLAIGTPLVAGILWGRFAAPQARHRLPLGPRVGFELSVFCLAALALLTASTALALVFAALVIINSVLLTLWRQWEPIP
jgi:quinol-cytochrome oxidoreductase complex cytochrome b subunit